VIFLPIRTFLSEFMTSICNLSVLMLIVSAPNIPIRCSRLTLLLPAPPHPTTRIFGSPNSFSSHFLGFLSVSNTVSTIFSPPVSNLSLRGRI
jgi:hypothetical protein